MQLLAVYGYSTIFRLNRFTQAHCRVFEVPVGKGQVGFHLGFVSNAVSFSFENRVAVFCIQYEASIRLDAAPTFALIKARWQESARAGYGTSKRPRISSLELMLFRPFARNTHAAFGI